MEDLHWTNTATTLFNNTDYDGALAALLALQPLARPDDAAFAQNHFVAKFFKSGVSHQNGLILLKHLKKLVADHRERPELLAVSELNCAVLYYWLRYYSHAADVLVRLSERFGQLEESAGVLAAFLLVDNFLRMGTLERTPVERSIHFLDSLISSKLKREKNGPVVEMEPVSFECGYQGDGLLPPVLNANQLALLLQVFKTRIQLLLNPYNDSLSGVLRDLTKNPHPQAPHLLANYYFRNGNYPEAFRVIREISSDVLRGKDSGKQEGKGVVGNNNLGCINLKNGKYAVAGVYFANALRGNQKEEEEENAKAAPKPQKVSFFSKDKKMDCNVEHRNISILYNLGLSFLLRGKPDFAFSCFQSVLQSSFNNPYLWLRIGECCILDHLKKKQTLKRKKNEDKSNEMPFPRMMDNVILKKSSGRVILTDSDPVFDSQSRNDPLTFTCSDARPTLHYGYACFGNVLPITSSTEKFLKEPSFSKTPSSPSPSPVPPPQVPPSSNNVKAPNQATAPNSNAAKGGQSSQSSGANPTSPRDKKKATQPQPQKPAGKANPPAKNATTVVEHSEGGSGRKSASNEPKNSLPGKASTTTASPTTPTLQEGEWVSWSISSQANLGLINVVAHVNMAWIALQLNDYPNAAYHSKRAITLAQQYSVQMRALQPSPSLQLQQQLRQFTRYLFLAHVYHAEGSINMGDHEGAKNALGEFLKNLENDGHAVETNGMAQEEDPARTASSKAAHTKSCLYTNLAIVNIIKGDLAEANRCMEEVGNQNPGFVPAMLVSIYLSLVNGNIKEALVKLKDPYFAPLSNHLKAKLNNTHK